MSYSVNHLFKHDKPLRLVLIYSMSYLVNYLYKRDKQLI